MLKDRERITGDECGDGCCLLLFSPFRLTLFSRVFVSFCDILWLAVLLLRLLLLLLLSGRSSMPGVCLVSDSERPIEMPLCVGWVVLGCVGLCWVVLGCVELCWVVFGMVLSLFASLGLVLLGWFWFGCLFRSVGFGSVRFESVGFVFVGFVFVGFVFVGLV